MLTKKEIKCFIISLPKGKKAQHISTTFLVTIILIILMGLALLFYIYKIRGKLLP